MEIKTKAGHIYIGTHNLKMKKTFTFNLPSVITCSPTALCRKICYAKKAERMYPSVLPCRMNNMEIVKTDSSWVHALTNRLQKAKLKFLRIHESGDFFDQHYLNQWIAIAQATPNIQFLAFTKQYDLNYSRLPKNFTVVFSVMSDSENVPKTMPLAFAGNCGGMSNYLECKGKCEECRLCWKLNDLKKNIHFKIH